MGKNLDPFSPVIVGLKRNIQDLGDNELVIKVDVRHFVETRDEIIKRASLVFTHIIDGFVFDENGKKYKYLPPDRKLEYPFGSIGLLSKDTINLPEEGSYIAKLWLTEYRSAHHCILTPLFPSIQGEQNQDIIYLRLIHRLMDLYSLSGVDGQLPQCRNLSPEIKISLPQNIFINYPQRPKFYLHDFENASPTLPPQATEVGPIVDLYNKNLVLSLGRAIIDNGKIVYGAILQRQDYLTLQEHIVRVYTLSFSVHNCVYWEKGNFKKIKYEDRRPMLYHDDPIELLQDIQELIILAFYRTQYADVLTPLQEKNREIKRYLGESFIYHKFYKKVGSFAPITCFECQEAKFVDFQYSLELANSIPCNECKKKWVIKAKLVQDD